MTQLRARTVICQGCGHPMAQGPNIAHVVWEWDDGHTSDVMYIRYECHTPDCGNVAQVEDS